MRKLNLIGHTFGRLKVMSEAPKWGNLICWNVLCICGKYNIVTTQNLRAGKTTSCGCYHKEIVSCIGKENATHGLSHLPEYSIWSAMHQRCNTDNVDVKVRYAGRGITICKRWDTFELFLEDMGKRPSADLTLDRIDNDKGYYKENCRWATRTVQNNNTNGHGYYSAEIDKQNKIKAREFLGFNN